MASNEQLLKDFATMKTEAEAARKSANELEGVIKRDEGRMEKEYGCKTIEAAEKDLSSRDNKIADKEDEFRERVENLKSKYPWKSSFN